MSGFLNSGVSTGSSRLEPPSDSSSELENSSNSFRLFWKRDRHPRRVALCNLFSHGPRRLSSLGPARNIQGGSAALLHSPLKEGSGGEDSSSSHIAIGSRLNIEGDGEQDLFARVFVEVVEVVEGRCKWTASIRTQNHLQSHRLVQAPRL